jgi:hypothetical protein
MSEQEVRKALGMPDRVTATAEGCVWHYSYGPRPDPARAAVGSVQAVGIVFIVVAQVACIVALLAFSHGGSTGDGSVSFWTPDWEFPDVSTASVHFRVYFDREGRVASISGLEAGGD